MKATRDWAPVTAVMVLVLLLGFAGLIAFGSGGWDTPGAQPPQATPLVDNGPNAGLSDAELLNRALVTMAGLLSGRDFRSFHAEETGWPLDGKSRDLRMSADVNTQEKGKRYAYGTRGVATDTLILLQATDEKFYVSEDGGQTWGWSNYAEPGFLHYIALFSWWDEDLPYWQAIWGTASGEGTPVAGPRRGGMVFKAASPPLEQIDGVVTRHLIADALSGPADEYQAGLNRVFPGIRTVSVWVSTELTPTVRQMIIAGTVPIPAAGTPPSDVPPGPYVATWKWSRFNEDVGRMDPPPDSTVKWR